MIKRALSWLFLVYVLWLFLPALLRHGDPWVIAPVCLLVVFACAPGRPVT